MAPYPIISADVRLTDDSRNPSMTYKSDSRPFGPCTAILLFLSRGDEKIKGVY